MRQSGRSYFGGVYREEKYTVHWAEETKTLTLKVLVTGGHVYDHRYGIQQNNYLVIFVAAKLEFLLSCYMPFCLLYRFAKKQFANQNT